MDQEPFTVQVGMEQAWTEVADMVTARYGLSTGTGTGGTICYWRWKPPDKSTEEWNSGRFSN